MIRLDTGKLIPDDTPILWGIGPGGTSSTMLAFALTRKEPRPGDVAYYRPPDSRFVHRVAFERPILSALPEIPELRRQLFLAKVRAAHAGGGA